jgi:hypothetical protein
MLSDQYFAVLVGCTVVILKFIDEEFKLKYFARIHIMEGNGKFTATS